MKTYLVAFACLLGMAMAGTSALGDNPAPASTPMPAAGSGWCSQHPKECQQRMHKAEQWCAKHQQECKQRMQKRAEWCKQNQEKCRSLMEKNRARIEAFCKQNPKDARCEKLEQYMQHKNASAPKSGPPPGI